MFSHSCAELYNSLSPLTLPSPSLVSETNTASAKQVFFYILLQEDPRTDATAAPLHTQLPSFLLLIHYRFSLTHLLHALPQGCGKYSSRWMQTLRGKKKISRYQEQIWKGLTKCQSCLLAIVLQSKQQRAALCSHYLSFHPH